MSYAAAIENLSLLIPELMSAPGKTRRKFSLHEIGILTSALDHPERGFPSVLVAGTNGKGSTSSTLASIGRASGLRVGLYTSPHLDRVNERIRLLTPATAVTESDIPDDRFAELYFRVHDVAQQLVLDGKLEALPSYFELLTALAFVYFQEEKVDLAVLEVGMGGRLDATNIVDPVLSVITDIALDHQEWLGSTIDLIAREKAGILRRDGALVLLPQHPLANQAIGEVATELNVRGVSATEYMPQIDADPLAPYSVEVMGQQIVVDSPLKGAHQHRNLALAIAAAAELSKKFAGITATSIAEGIKNTYWPGRLESLRLPGLPEIVFDVAHNPAGAWALRAALSAKQRSSEANAESVLLFGCLSDKPLPEMSQILFPIFDHVVLSPIHSPRATPVAELIAAADAVGVSATPAVSVEHALDIALDLHPSRIVISGSVYLVGEIRTRLVNRALPHAGDASQ
jgi:dihydrofolate synthase/folylpolyglutamate synthase